MPLLKCLNCQHEWEGTEDSKCDWCDSGGRILEEETPLEKATANAFKDALYLSKLMRGK